MRATASSGRRARGRLARLGAGALALMVVALLAQAPHWEGAEWEAFDAFTRWTAPRQAPTELVIVSIDEPTFQQLQQQWPFPRRLHAQLLERFTADGAAAVGFDVVFAEPSTEADDAALEGAIVRNGRVVLAATEEQIDGANASLWTAVEPLPRFMAAGARRGSIGVRPEEDYVVRRQPPGDDTLAAQVATVSGRTPARAAGPRALVGYLGPRGTVDTRSYYQAVTPGLLPPGFFKDKIVLVGRSSRAAVELARSNTDTFNSPFASGQQGDRLFPGVEIQATLVAHRLHGGGLHVVPLPWQWALVLALSAVLALGTARLEPLRGAALAAALGTCVCAASALLFARGWWLPPLWPLASIAALGAGATLLGWQQERRHARQVRGMFSQYVPPAVVDKLVAAPELLRLGGETREVTLLFTDLAGFTALSEQLSAEQTVELLHAYFGAMAPIIHAHQGTVDKYIGDAIMAFWGAPLDDARHAEHAVRAALAMQAAMDALGPQLAARGLPAPTMRIGLHSGRAVVGNVGADTRFSYTAIGDAVNLAARLEGANKAFGTRILLSRATARQLPPDIGLRPLGDVLVQGKREAVRVYTPCDDPDLCRASETVLAAADAKQWDHAAALLRAVLAEHPGDAAAEKLLGRVVAAGEGAMLATMALEKG